MCAMKEFEIIWEAINYAFIKYGNVKRKLGDIPYIIHPIRVTMILRAAGFSEFKDSNLMLAALFHDLLEDTNLSFEDLKAEFGIEVASIVKELSKPENTSKDEWLRTFGTASKESKLIKMADRIDNLKDMKLPDWSVEKQKKYAEQGLIILETCRDANSSLAKRLNKLIDKILNDF
jgi:guanosine-3',5'-bis(diphosphate) 3'-pyrophosphohydrolase